MPLDLTRLSKTMSHALRHAPEQYGLTLDPEGWVEVEAFVGALRGRGGALAELDFADCEAAMAASAKQRFQVEDGRIRARYGHSVAKRIELPAKEPPGTLFHGTPPKVATIIEGEGLRPMGRQYVHLSTDLDTARTVGRRRCKSPVIFRVDAARAHAEGQRFYAGEDGTWLTDSLGPEYLERLSE
jgi:putative RNA 2'-phosphotransferase